MLKIENVDKIVGSKIEWECERVLEFPGDDGGLIPSDEAYRFEYKAVSDYDVPLCIYLRRTPDENGIYEMENNLMDNKDWIKVGNIKNMKLFQKNLEMYATEVIMRWAKDQNML
jgi:hypothetical protein